MDNPIVNYDKQKESLTKEFNIFCKLCKCATYTNIYVDNKAEELFMSLFGENKLFIFTDFHEILQNHNHNHNHDIFIIYASYPKLDIVCQIISNGFLQEEKHNSKIISIPREITGHKFALEQYGLTRSVTYTSLPITFYYNNNNDNNSNNRSIIFNRKQDLLSTVNIDLSFRGYLYEKFGKNIFKELKDNKFYEKIKNKELHHANEEIKLEGDRLKIMRKWLDEYYAPDKIKSKQVRFADQCRDKMAFAKDKEQFEKVLGLALQLNDFLPSIQFQNYDTVPATPDQRYMLSFQKLMLTKKSIINEIQILIISEYPIARVLRLLCIESLVLNKINTKKLNEIKKDIVHTYGFKYIPVLQRLIDKGILNENINENINKKKTIMDIIKKYDDEPNISILFNGGITLKELDDIQELKRNIKIYYSKIIWPNEYIIKLK